MKIQESRNMYGWDSKYRAIFCVRHLQNAPNYTDVHLYFPKKFGVTAQNCRVVVLDVGFMVRVGVKVKVSVFRVRFRVTFFR